MVAPDVLTYRFLPSASAETGHPFRAVWDVGISIFSSFRLVIHSDPCFVGSHTGGRAGVDSCPECTLAFPGTSLNYVHEGSLGGLHESTNE